MMCEKPTAELELTLVLRSEIAMPLRHLMHITTVGSLVKAWQNPKHQKGIEQAFDSAEQARHALAVCSAWIGGNMPPPASIVSAWWPTDGPMKLDA